MTTGEIETARPDLAAPRATSGRRMASGSLPHTHDYFPGGHTL